MRIQEVRIKNFRSLKDLVIKLDNYTSFVGANGTGKSAVLTALNYFFGDPSVAPLEAEDFHKKDTSSQIEITVVFVDLSREEAEEFKDYYRQDKLIITAQSISDPASQKFNLIQYGSRLAMSDFRNFFGAEASGAKVSDLKDIYKGLKDQHPELPSASTKDAMITSLREHEINHPEQCSEIPSRDQFYGVAQSGKLNRYLQWVYIPAVKDASDEQRETRGGALGKLLSRTVNAKVHFDTKIKEIQDSAREKYDAILAENQSALDDVSKGLKKRLGEWAHPGVNLKIEWASDTQKAVQIAQPFAQLKIGEEDFEGQVSRLGHGLQRSYLIALLQELASMPTDSTMPKLILGCEEPELYQHPPQSRHLAGVLKRLGDDGSQVIITTHSPHFVSGETFSNVRVCRKKLGATEVSSLDIDKLKDEFKKCGQIYRNEKSLESKLYQVLQPQLAEMFFAKNIVLVEGIEDQAYLLSALTLFDKIDEFRKNDGHIVLVNGKSNLIPPIIIAQLMQIKAMVIFDADSNCDENHKPKHEKDNRLLLDLLGLTSLKTFPDSHVFQSRLIMWQTEIGDAFRSDCGEIFESIKSEVEATFGQPGNLEKNVLAIAERLALAQSRGAKLENLKKMSETVIGFLAS